MPKNIGLQILLFEDKPMQANKKWLGVFVAMQLLMLAMFFGQGAVVTSVKADGIPDAGAQRDQMLEQMKTTNEKLDKLLTLLSGGDLHVKLSRQDDKAENR